MSIGQRIKFSRKAAGISQNDLAQKVGLSQPTLSDLENDMSKGTSKLASIAQVLHVRPFWLETGRGPMASIADDQNTSTISELSAEAITVAQAFDRLETQIERDAVLAQLRAMLSKSSV